MPTTNHTDRPVHHPQVPRQFTPDRITGQLAEDHRPPTFHIYGGASALRVSREPGWLTTWGYLSDTTGYGCGRYPQFEARTGDLDLVAELRAAWHAIGQPIKAGPVTVVTRTCAAAYQLGAWRDGDTTLPADYDGYRAPKDGKPRHSTMEKLRRAIAAQPGNLTVSVSIDATQTALVEGAEYLAELAEQWARDNLGKDDVRIQAAETAQTWLAVQGRL